MSEQEPQEEEVRAADEAGATADDRGSRSEPDPGEEPQPEPASPEEVAAAGEDFVTGLLESLGVAAEVTSAIDKDTARIDVTGEDLGSLIGRRGQALDALQELTRTAVQRKLRSRVRLLVDVEGYRARRRDSLADYARSIAERAKERGTEIELEPMSAYERKIVHDAVAEIDGVSSFSEGEEPGRKVVVRAE